MHSLEGLQDYCLEPASSLVEASSTSRLFDTLFSSFSQCEDDQRTGLLLGHTLFDLACLSAGYLADQRLVKLRGVMCSGQPQRCVQSVMRITPSHLSPIEQRFSRTGW